MIHAATAQGRARSREARPDLSSAQRGQPPRPTWPALSRNSPEGRGGLCETWSVPLAPWARGHGGTPALTQPCPSRRAPFPPPRAPPRLVMPAPSALTRWRLTADCEGSSRAEPRKSHFYRLSLRPPRPRFRPRRALPAGHAGRLSPAEAWALARPNCDPEYLLLQARGCSTSGPRNPSPSLGLREVLQSQRSCSRLLAPKRDTLYIRLGDWVWGGRKPPSLRPSPRPPRPPKPPPRGLNPVMETEIGIVNRAMELEKLLLQRGTLLRRETCAHAHWERCPHVSTAEPTGLTRTSISRRDE